MGRNLFEYHAVIGYRYIPGLVARVRHEAGGYLVRCNQAGFRCEHEFTEKKTKDVFRVLVFGDSFTAGNGVSNGKRYSDLLDSRLKQVEVLNFGLPGSGPDQQFLIFQEYARQIDYDLVILAPMVADIWRIMVSEQLIISVSGSQAAKKPKPYYEFKNGQLRLQNQPVPRTLQPINSLELEQIEEKKINILKRNIRKIYKRYPELHCFLMRIRDIRSPVEYEDATNEAWLLMKAILANWIQQVKTPVLLSPIPTFCHINKCIKADGYLLRFTELAIEKNVEMIDILPEFWKLNSKKRRQCRFNNDDHPTELGHEVIANALLPHISKYYEQWRAKNV